MSIEVDNLAFSYKGERFKLVIDELSIEAGQPTAIIGPSGSGKTTLLRLIAGVLRPSKGTVRVLGEAVSDMADTQARAFRIQNIGLVFQEFELVDYLNGRDNILLPFRVSSVLTLTNAARQCVEELAEATGITHPLDARPTQLSQGERQRVAICRALVTRPRLVLAVIVVASTVVGGAHHSHPRGCGGRLTSPFRFNSIRVSPRASAAKYSGSVRRNDLWKRGGARMECGVGVSG